MVDANREIVVGAPPNNITNTVNNNKNNNNHYSAPQHHNTGGVPVYTQEYSLPHVNHENSLKPPQEPIGIYRWMEGQIDRRTYGQTSSYFVL